MCRVELWVDADGLLSQTHCLNIILFLNEHPHRFILQSSKLWTGLFALWWTSLSSFVDSTSFMYGTRSKLTLPVPTYCRIGGALIGIVIYVIVIFIVKRESLFDLIIIRSIFVSLNLVRLQPTYLEALSSSDPSSEPESDSSEVWSCSESSSSYATSASMLVSGIGVRED